MGMLTIRARGPLGPDTVWERYDRPVLWPTWAPHLKQVVYVPRRLLEGAEGQVIAVGGVRARFVVTAVDRATRTWAWRVRLGPLTLRLQHGVTPRHDGSATWLRLDGPIAVILPYAPLAHWALRRLVR